MKLNHVILLTIVVSCSNLLAQYCSPTFSVAVEPISNVTFNTINNGSSTSCTGGTSLESFTGTSTNITRGQSYTITVTGNTCGNYQNFFTVFFDWNQNNVLNDAGESFAIGSITNTPGVLTTSVSIPVPAGAALGSTRMRIVKNYSSSPTNPCGTYSYGQAEDYTVVIQDPLLATLQNTAANTSTSTSFAHRRGASINPKFTISGSGSFNAVQIELNHAADFSGTSLVSTFNDGTPYNASTSYDFVTSQNLTGDRTYFVRTRISNNAGSTWSAWTTQNWPYSYYPSTVVAEEGWYFTTKEQFALGTVQETAYNFTSALDNSTAYPDDDYLQINQGTFTVDATTADGVYENGVWYPSVAYQTIGWQNDCNGNAAIYNGFPFVLSIPQAAVINSADFSVYSTDACFCENQTRNLPLIIDAHNYDSGPALNATNVTSLTNRTTASQTFNYTTAWANNTRYTLTSVTNVLQEIVNRGGWTVGNTFNLLARWNPSYTPSSTHNRCIRQRDNGTSTSPRLTGTFTNFKNTIYFPAVNLTNYDPDVTSWDELKITDNTVGCGSCYVEYRIHDASNSAVVAGPFTRNAGLNGAESFDISSVGQANIFVSATIFRNNSPLVHDIWLTATSPVLLPVEFGNFDVSCEQGVSVLEWNTITEQNNDYFTIEESGDGHNWTEVVKVNGKRNSSSIQNYMTQDDSPSLYYRLKQTDVDGKMKVLATSSVDCSDGETKLFPNPSSGLVHAINLPRNAEIFVFDLEGRLVYNEKTSSSTHEIKLNNISDGNYIAVINGQFSSKKYKLVINK